MPFKPHTRPSLPVPAGGAHLQLRHIPLQRAQLQLDAHVGDGRVPQAGVARRAAQHQAVQGGVQPRQGGCCVSPVGQQKGVDPGEQRRRQALRGAAGRLQRGGGGGRSGEGVFRLHVQMFWSREP